MYRRWEPARDRLPHARVREGLGGLPPGPPRIVPTSAHRRRARRSSSVRRTPARKTSTLTWWRSVVGCVLFLVTRMRACACDTASRASRLCVRTVVCWSAFSLVPPLGSACSSAARAASFAGFTATMGESDSSGPFIVGFGLRPSRRGPCKTPQGRPRDLPVPEQKASAHARVYDDAGPTYVSRSRHGPYCLLQDGKHILLSSLRFAPESRGYRVSIHPERPTSKIPLKITA